MEFTNEKAKGAPAMPHPVRSEQDHRSALVRIDEPTTADGPLSASAQNSFKTRRLHLWTVLRLCDI
jgi:hypothetical protein